jgi:hypothetical protein
MKNFPDESINNGSPLALDSWQSFNPESLVFQQILAWTNGQPQLTKRLKSLITKKDVLPEFDLNDLSIVNQAVQEYFTLEIFKSSDLEDSEVIELLEIIRDALQDSKNLSLMEQYKDILIAKPKKLYGGSLEQDRLLKIGIISLNSEGQLVVSNQIYKKIFSLSWTEQQIERQLGQKRLDKYHLALITGLISVLVFTLFQGFTRYMPYTKLIQCSGNPIFKTAIDANVSLDEVKIDRAVEQLQKLQQQQQLSSGCEAILHDLLYSQAIYIKAGIGNNPLEAVKVLCNIPERYYWDRNIQPWFTRWSSLYRKTSFPSDLNDYISNSQCPASGFLSR